MWLSQFRDRIIGRRFAQQVACKPRRARLGLEALEGRMLPSNYTAGSVADLIADINAANQAGGSNTILLAANTTFDLTMVNNTSDGANGLPVIVANNNLTISGQGGDILQRDPAAAAFRLFDVASGASLALTNLTLQNGQARGFRGSAASAEGGAIYNQGGLDLNGVVVQNNLAQGTLHSWLPAGGGIYSDGVLTLEGGTRVQNNQALAAGFGQDARGGGLYLAGGTATVSNASLSSNQAQGSPGLYGIGVGYGGGGSGPGGPGGNGLGGALYVAGGTVTLTGDTLSANSAQGGPGGAGSPGGPGGNGFGGALYAAGGTLTMRNDTVTDNAAVGGAGGSGSGSPGKGEGGGLYIDRPAAVYLDAFTVANVVNNTASTSDPNIHGSYHRLR